MPRVLSLFDSRLERTLLMGAANSRGKCLEAEKELLQWGVDWWTGQKQTGSGGKSTISFEQADNAPATQTTAATQPRDFHLHSVRYTSTSNPASEHTAPPLVVMHGYLNGTGIFYTVAPALAETWPGPVYFLDMAGCGLSSRPAWTGGFGESSDLQTTEDYFTESLEGWRERMGIKKYVLAGHSMGGYLATCYAEKYPDRLAHLVLLSPVGIPDRGDAGRSRADMPFFFRMAFNMWDRGWSPMNIPGTWHLVHMYGNKRYPDASWVNKPLLSKYKYYSWVCDNPSAGAYTHSTLLKPGAWARSPLIHRLPAVAASLDRISFVYGARDWMSPDAAEDFRRRQTASASSCPIDIVRVAGAGHNFMVDNPGGTVQAILAVLQNGLEKKATQTLESNEKLAVYGNMEWLVERGLAGPNAPDLVGRLGLEGLRSGKEWEQCEVVADHGDGTLDLRWSKNQHLVRRFSGARVRLKEAEEGSVAEKLDETADEKKELGKSDKEEDEDVVL